LFRYLLWRQDKKPMRFFKRSLVFFFALSLSGCTQGDTLDKIRRSGKLVVLTINSPTTYFIGRDGSDGYEYALTQKLGATLGVDVEYRVLDSIEAILTAIKKGEGHLAAAGLTRTDGRAKQFLFGPDYKIVRQQVVCQRKRRAPRELAELAGISLAVAAGSSYEEHLREIENQIQDFHWTSLADHSSEQMLERVGEAKLDCTVADSNIIAINRRYYPALKVAFSISEEQPLAWILTPGAKQLAKYLSGWFVEQRESGYLNQLNTRYYGFTEIFDFVDTRAFIRRIDKRLPKYQQHFESAADKVQLPWTLLAAQAYQESHWNPQAISPTGVRGIMMLTLPTASEVGVKNRLDPIASIQGGARYLQRLLKRLPVDIEGEDRLWIALATYNVGYGHIMDARQLAKRLDKNPNSWGDLQSVLPLLSRKEYYRSLKHGYARGKEPVQYVRRIRNYRDILEKKLMSGKKG